MKKQKFKNIAVTFIFGIIIWCILQNSYTFPTLIEAVLFSFMASFIQAGFFHIEDSKHESLNIRPFTILKYIVNLIIQIYAASFKMIINIIKGQENVKVVRVPTKLTNHWHRIITATSITLTPGTVTITEQKKYFWVVAIDLSGETKEDRADEIKGSFENILLADEKHGSRHNKAMKQDGEKND